MIEKKSAFCTNKLYNVCYFCGGERWYNILGERIGNDVTVLNGYINRYNLRERMGKYDKESYRYNTKISKDAKVGIPV